MIKYNEVIPIKINGSGVQYFSYKCVKCGEEARNTYEEPYRSNMLKRQLCWDCNYWKEEEERLEKYHTRMTIIEGRIYSPGNRTTGEWRGMAGRRFDIEYIAPSFFAGKRITTYDLWTGSTMPEDMQAKFKDTARFLGDAKEAKVGEIVCWNQSSDKNKPYPLPKSIVGLK